MYSRVTLFELDPLRFDLEAAVDRFTERVLPDLREQPGYEGVYVLVSPDAKGLVVSFWDSQADADAALHGGFYAAAVERFVTIFSAPPGREGYDVVVADAPALAPG
ncbi:MAG: antibiotic biosynthesis monooxygenase [Thermoleophilia bacterium]|nr:antibiotic biosynthesis monooxygenase [Thermoleophilia bacterium]